MRRKIKRVEKDIASSGILRAEMLLGVEAGKDPLPATESEDGVPRTVLQPFAGNAANVADDLIRGAHHELQAALEEHTFQTWSERLADMLTVWARTRMDALEEDLKSRKPMSQDGRRYAEAALAVHTEIIMNKPSASHKQVDALALTTFGQRAALRFERELVTSQDGRGLLDRLDRCDKQRAEMAMIRHAHSVRISLARIAYVVTAVALGIVLHEYLGLG